MKLTKNRNLHITVQLVLFSGLSLQEVNLLFISFVSTTRLWENKLGRTDGQTDRADGRLDIAYGRIIIMYDEKDRLSTYDICMRAGYKKTRCLNQ
jgi:hypothetical protein